MKIGLLGKKIGMTRVDDDKGKATPVTVIEAGGNTALQIKTEDSDGYSSVQVGFDAQKPQRVTQPLLGHFKKASSEPKKFIREFRLPEGTALEGAVDLNVSQFSVGDVVDVIGR